MKRPPHKKDRWVGRPAAGGLARNIRAMAKELRMLRGIVARTAKELLDR